MHRGRRCDLRVRRGGNIYTAPRLLDLQGTVESLTEFSVTNEPTENRQRIAAGAETFHALNLVGPLVAPTLDVSRDLQSTAVTYAAISSELSDSPETQKTPRKTTFPRSSGEYARRESNPQPSDPKSGATSIEPTKRQRVAKRRSRRGSSGGSSSPENAHGKAVGESLPIKADSFSAALAMIASLPLSDAEKADAVRRLMAERTATLRQ